MGEVGGEVGGVEGEGVDGVVGIWCCGDFLGMSFVDYESTKAWFSIEIVYACGAMLLLLKRRSSICR